ncbi:MAG: hypothetical protein K0Q77_2672 [Anaerosporomusa subterranea]|jgi:hypothetical protein|nr:hypothetical protein [Anaerosporomusa subterranea]
MANETFNTPWVRACLTLRVQSLAVSCQATPLG